MQVTALRVGHRTFGEASLAQAAVDLIDDGAGGDLLIEVDAHGVNYRRRDQGGAVTQVVRVLPTAEGSSILSSDLWGAVRYWSLLPAVPRARFILHSDGPLYPTATPAVADRLARFAEGCASDEDVHVVRMVGLDPRHPLLRSVRLRCQAGSAEAVLAGVHWRIQRLPRRDPSPGAAAGVADRLIRHCSAPAGTGEPLRVTRRELAETAGVDLDALDSVAATTSGSVLPGLAVAAHDAVVHGLLAAIHRQAAAATGGPFTAAQCRQLLASPGFTVRLVGAGAAKAGTLVAEEVRAAREANPALRIVLVDSGR